MESFEPFQIKHRPDFNPDMICPDFEGNFVAAVKDRVAITLLGDPSSIWAFKPEGVDHGPGAQDYGNLSLMVKLSTGEVFIPGRELKNFLVLQSRGYTDRPKITSINALSMHFDDPDAMRLTSTGRTLKMTPPVVDTCVKELMLGSS